MTVSVAPKLLWFFLWRMALLSLGFGALAGALYAAGLPFVGLAFAALTGRVGEALAENGGEYAAVGLLLWVVFAAPIGALVGAAVGLTLGALCGPLLAASIFVFPRSTDARGYRLAAVLTCVAVCLLAFFFDWAVFGGFGPYGVAPLRVLGLLARGDVSILVGGQNGSESVDPSETVVLAVAPVAVAVAAVACAGWLTAGWYERKQAAR